MFPGLNGKKKLRRRKRRRELKFTWVGNGVFKEYVWEKLETGVEYDQNAIYKSIKEFILKLLKNLWSLK